MKFRTLEIWKDFLHAVKREYKYTKLGTYLIAFPFAMAILIILTPLILLIDILDWVTEP